MFEVGVLPILFWIFVGIAIGGLASGGVASRGGGGSAACCGPQLRRCGCSAAHFAQHAVPSLA